MTIPEHVLQDIRDRVSILDVVGTHVSLKRAGRTWKGLCPFHSEKTPSFVVNEERSTYKCFGCGKGGNAFTFIMEMEGKSFPEAVEALALKAGVTIPREEESPAEKGERRERALILEVLALASRYYRHQFTDGRAGEKAREYAAQRGIGNEASENFLIGAAPPGWDNLARFLGKKGIDLSLGERAGILAKRESGGYYDRFRDRLIFPITDATGRTVSFGGRIMGEGEPKYLNGPETEVFLKGRVLYGLFQGGEALRKNNRAILVEGYMDVVILHQKGYPGCLATLGTALTKEHVEAIRRRADEAVLVYDGDEPGQKAMERSLEIFLREGFPCKAVVLPPKEDPDSFVSGGGNLYELIDGAPWLFDATLARIAARNDIGSVVGRLSAADEIVEILRNVRQDRGQGEYVKRAAEVLRVDEDFLRRRLLEPSRGPREKDAEVKSPKETPRDPQQTALLKCLLHWPDRRKEFLLAEGEKWVDDRELAKALKFVANRYEPASVFPIERIDEGLRSLVALLVMEESTEDDYESLVAALEARRLRKMAEDLGRRIKEAEEKGDWDEFSRLAREKTRIDREISEG